MDGVDHEKADAILLRARGGESLLLKDAIAFLAACGFPFPPFATASTEEEAVERWRLLDAPVAMKISLPHISHKSDFGLVVLDLHSEHQIRSAFRSLQARAETNDVEVVIQKMAGVGREVILGGKRDDTFGPAVVFGLGGIFVEVLEDAVWGVAPLNREEARRMIRRIRGWKVLEGTRGQKPSDTETLVECLVRLSWMMTAFPPIREIDINPLMVFPEGMGAWCLDARIVLESD
jgi:hypothetical protein